MTDKWGGLWDGLDEMDEVEQDRGELDEALDAVVAAYGDTPAEQRALALFLGRLTP